ncbi:MAG: YpdA family putative bacillithiol disulfide reductase [Acidobacteriota bacterium]
MTEQLDLIIVGGGPAGLACGIEAKKRGLNFNILEKGCIVNSIFHFPTHMTFFTTAELLEIGDIPMIVSSEKPKRLDGLKYYRRVSDHYALPIRDYERVLSVSGRRDNFRVASRDRFGCRNMLDCRRIIIATGYFDNPNRLDVPGEDLPKVSHYYTDPHPYFRKKVAVIGGKNSAAIAALELYRNGTEVSLVHRAEAMRKEVKYWILPDINNRIKNGEVRAFFSSRVQEIRDKEIVLCTPEGVKVLENDFVLALVGYHPDTKFLQGLGIEVDPETLIPQHDPTTLETNVPGIYLAGAITSGKMTNRIFIENGRFHGEQIFHHWEH